MFFGTSDPIDTHWFKAPSRRAYCYSFDYLKRASEKWIEQNPNSEIEADPFSLLNYDNAIAHAVMHQRTGPRRTHPIVWHTKKNKLKDNIGYARKVDVTQAVQIPAAAPDINHRETVPLYPRQDDFARLFLTYEGVSIMAVLIGRVALFIGTSQMNNMEKKWSDFGIKKEFATQVKDYPLFGNRTLSDLFDNDDKWKVTFDNAMKKPLQFGNLEGRMHKPQRHFKPGKQKNLDSHSKIWSIVVRNTDCMKWNNLCAAARREDRAGCELNAVEIEVTSEDANEETLMRQALGHNNPRCPNSLEKAFQLILSHGIITTDFLRRIFQARDAFVVMRRRYAQAVENGDEQQQTVYQTQLTNLVTNYRETATYYP